MSRIDRATAKGLAAIKRVAGVPLTLTRGGVSVEVTGIRGSTPAEVESSESQRLRVFRSDYLIDAADYDFGAGPVEPAIGDGITDDGHTFEVASLGSGEPPWRWHDRGHTRYRVHTVEI